MRNLRKRKTTRVQVDTQSDSGWEEESEVESVSNYEPLWAGIWADIRINEITNI